MTVQPPVVEGIDAAGDVIVNGKVHKKTDHKVYFLLVTNLGDSPITVDPTTDIDASVLVNGVENGSVEALTGPKTIAPGDTRRFPLRWTGDGSLDKGDTVEFTACVNLAGDVNPANNCDSETRTAVGKGHCDKDHGYAITRQIRAVRIGVGGRRSGLCPPRVATQGSAACEPLDRVLRLPLEPLGRQTEADDPPDRRRAATSSGARSRPRCPARAACPVALRVREARWRLAGALRLRTDPPRPLAICSMSRFRTPLRTVIAGSAIRETRRYWTA